MPSQDPGSTPPPPGHSAPLLPYLLSRPPADGIGCARDRLAPEATALPENDEIAMIASTEEVAVPPRRRQTAGNVHRDTRAFEAGGKKKEEVRWWLRHH